MEPLKVSALKMVKAGYRLHQVIPNAIKVTKFRTIPMKLWFKKKIGQKWLKSTTGIEVLKDWGNKWNCEWPELLLLNPGTWSKTRS